ncbi:hypothetical protein Taro_009854 [Colocasia esculenta]|uniref:Uncharacterized protein n=1 Tax=Colocasia esculenta TaxID=4460 RepID=A0A843U583_COLES|nr:hypothetical protein [Colocasia esculenta]
MLPSPVCGVSPVSGRFPEEESLEPPTGLKATYPVLPSDWRRRFYLREGPNGCVLRVEVSLPSSGRARVGRRRRGGSLGPRS